MGYDKKNPVLESVSVTFPKGLTGMIGVNGIGKSTLLKTIAGLLNPVSGTVAVNEKILHDLSFEERAKNISVVLTEKISDAYFSVFDIVLSGRSPHTGFTGKPGEKDISLAENYLDKCGVAHLRDKKINEVSDGEKQKCMIARALTQETPVILLDEPTSFLDFRARYEIMELLSKISEEENKVILFSSHDLDIIFRSTQRCIVLLDKKEYVFKNTEELADSSIPQKLFEGTNLFFDKATRSINYRKINSTISSHNKQN